MQVLILQVLTQMHFGLEIDVEYAVNEFGSKAEIKVIKCSKAASLAKRDHAAYFYGLFIVKKAGLF